MAGGVEPTRRMPNDSERSLGLGHARETLGRPVGDGARMCPWAACNAPLGSPTKRRSGRHKLAQAKGRESGRNHRVARKERRYGPCSRGSAMTSRIVVVSGIVGALGALGGCGSSAGLTPSGGDGAVAVSLDQAGAARQPADDVPPAALQAAVDANNAFALALYAQVSPGAATSNLLTSPISASLALTMAYAGAAGTTASQMAGALQIDADAGTSIFEGQNALSQALASRGPGALTNEQQEQPDASADNFQLEVVNSVWGQSSYPWATPYLSTLATNYGAGVYLEDFATQSSAAQQAINAWVSSETDDEINNLLPAGALDSMTRLVLVNALHLKFPWESPFDPSATTTGSFVRGDGATVSPSFMNQTETLPYVDDGQAQIAAIPLNGGLAIVVALPHADIDLATYEAGLSAAAPPLAQPSSTALVALSLPKLTFTSPTFSLATPLQAMGMVQAFDPTTADFLGMCPDPPDGNLYISDVLQKATVSMTETGVEAAAATAVIVGYAAVESPPPQPVSLVVNRPYLVTILDVATGAILFLGHIEDPTASGSP